MPARGQSASAGAEPKRRSCAFEKTEYHCMYCIRRDRRRARRGDMPDGFPLYEDGRHFRRDAGCGTA